VRELQEPLRQFGLNVLGLDALTCFSEQELDVEENGNTFLQNALLKATAITQLTGLTSVADDSGLLVDALDGAPGVHSARYADDLAYDPKLSDLSQDDRNIHKLLLAMAKIPKEQRAARFCSVMAAVQPSGKTIHSEGFWEGMVAFAPEGTYGFGYDPVFFDPQLKCTAAQMPLELKMTRSHRAKALAALLGLWPDFWNSAQ
jgi:XTP/dITP diphosphohydrolase